MNVIRRISLLLVTCSVLMLAGCASDGSMPDQRTTANAQDDINQLHAAFMKAFNAKDATALAATYTDDAILMAPNMPETKTAIGIETESHQMFANTPVSGILLNVTETQMTGNGWAYCSGFYTLLGPNNSTLDRGKFLEVVKQTDTGWKIHRDAYSSDMPAQGMAAPAAGTAMAPAAATH
ncbi:MAG TPA: SgcJ/EcaC family oxidoreductase [Gammaproteobacteria bacterium]|jgi:uncharacterized protein (TIGR02246 family)